MGRFINGDRARNSPRSRLNNRISPARFENETKTPPSQRNGEQKESEHTVDEDQPTNENKPKKKKPSKRRHLRRSRRQLVLMKSHPELKLRSCQKRIVLMSKSQSGKIQSAKMKSDEKTKK